MGFKGLTFQEDPCRNFYPIGWLAPKILEVGIWKLEVVFFSLAGFWKLEVEFWKLEVRSLFLGFGS